MGDKVLIDGKYRYSAFISYSWNDEKWACWLQNKLESYNLPTVIHKERSDLPKHLHIFRDKTDIRSGEMKHILHKELDSSKFLIVICSPFSAQSEWVGKEISHFIDSGHADRIIPFIVGGTPYSNDSSECYSPVLRGHFNNIYGINPLEPGEESRYVKRKKAYVRVVATLIDVDFDTLWNRHRKRQLQKITFGIITAGCIAAALAFAWIAGSPFNCRISINDTSAFNHNLPSIKDGKVILNIGNETMTATLDSATRSVTFTNIPGHDLGNKASLSFRAFGFKPVTTEVEMSRQIRITVERDSAFGKIQGYVRSRATDEFVGGIRVMVLGHTAITDNRGYFVLFVPVREQRQQYTATVQGAKPQQVFPTQDDNTLMNTLYY
ncbi:MAG: toll/interleukin-1 receptor domain-containing protein [Muribaculaceae bacterium]|jgi:hypothetical protein|nr:toll/interleukin-1 receptor domain-containing protein [Muribaculaceae bacterium]